MLLQALLSRGDRRLSRLLLLVRQYGDSLGSFRRAFKELQGQLPPMEHYVSAHYDPEEAGERWVWVAVPGGMMRAREPRSPPPTLAVRH